MDGYVVIRARQVILKPVYNDVTESPIQNPAAKPLPWELLEIMDLARDFNSDIQIVLLWPGIRRHKCAADTQIQVVPRPKFPSFLPLSPTQRLKTQTYLQDLGLNGSAGPTYIPLARICR